MLSVLNPMIKISARLNDAEFLGTAEDLAAFVSEKLAELGFGTRHRSTERLVRFYAYEGLLSKPERALDDRRKANFGPLQVRQLLLARLLAERGWDLDRIRNLLKENTALSRLNELIDELATPTEAEKLFFKTRSTTESMGLESQGRGMSVSESTVLHKRSALRHSLSSDYADQDAQPARPRSYTLGHQLRQVSETESPAEAFRYMIKKELIRPDISPEARELFNQLIAFNPSSRGDEPKRERWTRLRLTHWCEAHFNIDSRAKPTREELLEIVDNFSNALMKNYL